MYTVTPRSYPDEDFIKFLKKLNSDVQLRIDLNDSKRMLDLVKMWNIQTKKEGTDAIMKPYQKIIIKRLMDSDYFITTGQMHTLVNEELGPKENGRDAISRASVINFMHHLHKYDYALMKEDTGKGGVHRKYNMTITNEEFVLKFSSDVLEPLADALTQMFK